MTRTSLLALALVAAGALPGVAGADEAPAAATITTTTTTTVTTVAVVPVAPDPGPPWTFAALADDAVPFQGIADMDNAGSGAGQMFYPAFGLVGALAAVATHAAIMSGVQSHQKSQLQLAADKVLDPYRDALANFRLRDLQQRALALTPTGAVGHLRGADEAPAGEIVVQAAPVFSMTPDAAALVLDATVVVHAAGNADKIEPHAVRVVSAPGTESDLQAAWNADNGALLKSTAAAMVAEALAIALAQARHPADDKAAFRTVRYELGDGEKMERAQLVDETCAHLLLRNLRGTIMSVPHRPGATLPDGCAPVAGAPKRAWPAAAGASGATAFDPAG